MAEISDRGGGFDPSDLAASTVCEPGGLGIPLMKALADEVQFERSRTRMTVRLVKQARSPSSRRRPVSF